jgi:hypothetical protein
MKFLILVLLFFTHLISSAEWSKLSENTDGDSFYADFDRIKKNNGYVYFWRLSDYVTPSKYGTLSIKNYDQVECSYPRYKTLSMIFYKESMGIGSGETYTPEEKWIYAPPNSSAESVLKRVCGFIK